METQKQKKIGRKSLDQKSIESGELLPDEIIFNILSKLPITSVLQCMCVCKSWLAMIRDPQFAYAHLPFAQSTGTDPSIILLSRNRGFPNKFYFVESDTFKIFNPITLFPKACNARNIVGLKVVGSCNGLICLGRFIGNDPVYICNPLTRQSMALPPSTHCSGSYAALGFGFASNTKEYKVVKIEFINDDNGGAARVTRSRVEVYTLGTGYWRSKGTTSYLISFHHQWNTFTNGAVHWMSSLTRNSVLDNVIVSFDMGDEEFRMIPLPDVDQVNVVTLSSNVGSIEGCLSLHNYSMRRCIDIWIMKDYGVKESWSKYFVFPEDLYFLHPLHICRNGKHILCYRRETKLRRAKKLVNYDVESKSLTDLQLHGVPNFYLVYSHVASLITLESACGGENMSESERIKIKQG